MRKYLMQRGAVTECHTLLVDANWPVIVEVDQPDDFQRTDGEVDFCRIYTQTVPLTVRLTAPLVTEEGHEFWRWYIDGEEQPIGQNVLDVFMSGQTCHTAYAVYGAVIEPIDLGCGIITTVPELCRVRLDFSYSRSPHFPDNPCACGCLCCDDCGPQPRCVGALNASMPRNVGCTWNDDAQRWIHDRTFCVPPTDGAWNAPCSPGSCIWCSLPCPTPCGHFGYFDCQNESIASQTKYSPWRVHAEVIAQCSCEQDSVRLDVSCVFGRAYHIFRRVHIPGMSDPDCTFCGDPGPFIPPCCGDFGHYCYWRLLEEQEHACAGNIGGAAQMSRSIPLNGGQCQARAEELFRLQYASGPIDIVNEICCWDYATRHQLSVSFTP